MHARYAAENTFNPHTVVRASDTAIFILLLLLHFGSQLDAQICMDTGSISLNTRSIIDILSMANTLGAIVCAALTGFHALAWSDFNSIIYEERELPLI